MRNDQNLYRLGGSGGPRGAPPGKPRRNAMPYGRAAALLLSLCFLADRDTALASEGNRAAGGHPSCCLLYTSPSPRD